MLVRERERGREGGREREGGGKRSHWVGRLTRHISDVSLYDYLCVIIQQTAPPDGRRVDLIPVDLMINDVIAHKERTQSRDLEWNWGRDV